MFQVTRSGEHHLHIEFAGTLNSEEMEVAIEEFLHAAEGIEKGTMLYEVGEFEFPSLKAVAVKLGKLPLLFGFIGKFRKAAIITDKNWLHTVSEIEGWLIPGLDIKAFSSNEKEAAEAWLQSS